MNTVVDRLLSHREHMLYMSTQTSMHRQMKQMLGRNLALLKDLKTSTTYRNLQTYTVVVFMKAKRYRALTAGSQQRLKRAVAHRSKQPRSNAPSSPQSSSWCSSPVHSLPAVNFRSSDTDYLTPPLVHLPQSPSCPPCTYLHRSPDLPYVLTAPPYTYYLLKTHHPVMLESPAA